MVVKDRPIAKGQNQGAENGKKPGNDENGKAPEQKPTATEKEAKPTESKAEPTKQEPEVSKKLANATDRLNRFEQFQKLGERFSFLKDKDRELKNFQVSQDGTLAKITLECSGNLCRLYIREVCAEIKWIKLYVDFRNFINMFRMSHVYIKSTNKAPGLESECSTFLD